MSRVFVMGSLLISLFGSFVCLDVDYNISPKRCIGNTLDSNAAMESFDNHSKTRFATATTSPVRKPGFPKVASNLPHLNILLV